MKYYIITGEASGDLHGSNLVKQIIAEDKEAEFRFWGGDEMEKVLGKPAKHIRDLAFMGFVEVLMNLKTILGNIKFCKKDVAAFKPDALILIDYPGFNLRMAAWAKSQNIKTIYYISPKVWAWKQSRVHKIKQVVDKMYTILPFENDFYKKFDYEVEYVGHPLLDQIANFNKENEVASFTTDAKIIALLPGSRKQEISRKLPVMLEAVKDIKGYTFVVAGAPSMDPAFYKQFQVDDRIKIVFGKTYDLLNNATAALVTSGTATLETALFDVPEVVCYKANSISYHIAKRLIKVEFISLVNLILNREVVRELIQDDCNPTLIRKELEMVLPGGSKREKLLKDYKELKEVLGGVGASKRIAQSLISYLKK